MKKISVDEINEELILGRDVCGPSGNVLLGKGTKVGPAMGRRLKNWGITTLFIEGEEAAQVDGTLPQTTPGELKERLEKKFSRVMDSVIMKQIFAAVYQYRLQKN